ncbi:MAG: DUF1272 domain-containing protein [Wenzhouxiangellaceae bacterium]
MLELRPICEHCASELPPDSDQAMICSFECTFCRECVDTVLANVCPNCGGGFSPRPIRPAHDWKKHSSLRHHPAVVERRHRPVDEELHQQLIDAIDGRLPSQR